MQSRGTFPELSAGRSKGSALGRLAKSALHPSKIPKVMHEFKAGTLHSGSKKGPKVTNRKQAVAIALSEADDDIQSRFSVKKRAPKRLTHTRSLAGNRAEARRRAGVAHGD